MNNFFAKKLAFFEKVDLLKNLKILNTSILAVPFGTLKSLLEQKPKHSSLRSRKGSILSF